MGQNSPGPFTWVTRESPGRDTHEPSESCPESSSLPLGFVVLTGSPQSCPPPQQAHLTCSHALSMKASGSGGTRVDLPPPFPSAWTRAQGTGLWAFESSKNFQIRSASQTVQDPRTKASPQLPSSLSPLLPLSSSKKFTIPHTKVGVSPPSAPGRQEGSHPGQPPIRAAAPKERGGGEQRPTQFPSPHGAPLLPRAPAITRYEGVCACEEHLGEHSVPQ